MSTPMAISLDDKTAWKYAARLALETLAVEGNPITTDNLRMLGIPEPWHPNAWGQLFRTAHTHGVIEPHSICNSPRKQRHGALVRVWIGTEPYRSNTQKEAA